MDVPSPKPNRMFSEMLKAARQALELRDPADAARAAGVEYDPARRAFRVSTLGETVEISLPDLSLIHI